MKKFNISRILIPTDFSETGMLAIEHGAYMARLFAAELHLLHVIEVNEYAYDIPEPVLRLTKLDNLQEIVGKKMEEVVQNIQKEYGLKAITLSSTGRIATEIVNYADEKKIDVIVMGTHGASGFEEFFMGSNAHKVVNRANCPVISVQTHAKALGFNNIVLPIDNTLHSRQKVDYAIELAKHYKSTIHILGLLESHEDNDEGKFNIKVDSVVAAVHKAGIPNTRKIVEGSNLAVSAMDYSKSINADLIVIMTDHESALTGIFIGSLAKQIVNHSRIPVMSIKPEEGAASSYNPSGSPSLNN
ncbi:MAG TPA: universal stress protein [Bacteroidia bacterium]|jgi:nucleotide-binding universal stress UspA family protein|nr:universal stress protein [Bacteroidia bacterium]